METILKIFWFPFFSRNVMIMKIMDRLRKEKNNFKIITENKSIVHSARERRNGITSLVVREEGNVTFLSL